LRAELVELVSRRPVTTLLVTHDVEEAAALADRLILLSPSPARVLAELPIESPRRARTADELVAIRNEIARKIAGSR
jgi:NitT/TauT family transport system ATP-binding protein